MGDKGYLGLPRVSVADFNRLSKEIYGDDGPLWVSDHGDDGLIDLDEIGRRYRRKYVKSGQFTPLFNSRYIRIVRVIHARQKELVRAELDRTRVISNKTDFGDRSQTEKALFRTLLEVGEIMEALEEIQLGSGTIDPADLGAYGAEMMARYRQPWCQTTDDPLCNILVDFRPRSYPLYGVDISPDSKPPAEISPFMAVISDKDGKPIGIPYADVPVLKEGQGRAATLLRKAAELADQIAREPNRGGEAALATYLRAVAAAFESSEAYPFNEADEAWQAMADSGSHFYVRIGPDEVDVTGRALFAASLGLIDPEADKLIETLTPYMPVFERRFAEIIGNPYQPRTIKVHTPEFIDVAAEFGFMRGDARYLAGAQTLPNWCGKDGKADCQRRNMIFQRTAVGYTIGDRAKYFLLIDPEAAKFYSDSSFKINSAIHELVHNLGPQMAEHRERLGGIVNPLEEFKAQTGVIILIDEMQKLGLIDAETAKQHYTTAFFWILSQIKSGPLLYREGKLHTSRNPYVQFAAYQLGTMLQFGAVTFNPETNQFSFNFDKFPEAAEEMLHEIGQLYTTGETRDVAALFERYTKGAGLETLHLDLIDRTIGKTRGTRYRYEITGLTEETYVWPPQLELTK